MKKVLFLVFAVYTCVLLQAQVTKSINLTSAGTLSTVLTTTEKSTVTNLILTGNINALDFKSMRDEMSALADLDISGVLIEAYNGAGGTCIYQTTYSYPTNEIPISALHIDGSTIGKSSLVTVHLPTSITSIGSMAFYGCNNLKNIDFPASLTSIQAYAFCYCHGLTGTMNIPAQITTLGENAFGNCNGLTEFTVSENNPNYSSQDGILYNKYKSIIYQCPCGKSGPITIPYGVSTIWSGAFRECVKLTGSLELPNTVTYIGEHAFSSCEGFTGEFVFPDQVNYIGGWAFFQCTGFSGFRLLSATPPTLAYTYCFLNTTTPIYIPAGSLEAYSTAAEWSEYSSRFVGSGSYSGGCIASNFAGGDGSAASPYQISNVCELAYLAQLVNDKDSYMNNGNNYSLGKYFVLTSNIDMNGVQNKWGPIGNIESWTTNNKFQGTFDGANYEIQNLEVQLDGSGKDLYGGLFGYTGTESVIKNVVIDANSHVNVSGTQVLYENYAAGLCAYNNGRIENCRNYAAVNVTTDDSNYAGGIAGYNNGEVMNCNNSGAILATGMVMSFKNAGGIVGYNEGYVYGCYNNGYVKACDGIYNEAGGIVAYSWSTRNIENCYNDGGVEISGGSWGNYTGGVVGMQSMGDVINCVNTGVVKISGNAPGYIGGITGRDQGKIINSYNTGNIYASGSPYCLIGGIAGECVNGGIKNCYNSGSVVNSGSYYYSGGITGSNSTCELKNCYSLSTAGVNPGINIINQGTLTGATVSDNSNFDYSTSLSSLVSIEGDASGNMQDYLMNALNKWVSCNTSTGSPYRTWISVKTFNNGFPIYGNSIELPLILTHPINQNVYSGQNTTIFVSVKKPGNNAVLSYQWQESTDSGNSWSDIPLAIDSAYTTDYLTVASDGLKIRCVVTNTTYSVYSKVNSNPSILTVINDPSTEFNANLTDQLQIFPNPAVSYFQVQNINVDSRMIIYNALGEKVLEKTLTQTDNVINVSNLSSGIYVFTLKGEKFKLIKK